MGLYETLQSQKDQGEILDFNLVTEEKLKQLFCNENKLDSQIADLFNISISKVRYKRRKHGITFQNKLMNILLDNKDEISNKYNEEARQRMLAKKNIDILAKAVTHFAFRNGPVEDMHANGQLSQEDMKVLNKFMVNRLAFIFQLMIENRWLEFEYLIRFDSRFGSDWDPAEPDDGRIREIIMMSMDEAKNNGGTSF